MKLLGKVDRSIFLPAVIVYTLIFLFILIAPTTAADAVESLVSLTLNSWGFVYVLVYAFFLIAFIAIGASKYGKLKLGNQDDKPEFSFFSWMGMLFGAGLGVGLVFYGVSEPVSHFMDAPFTDSGTIAAANDAMRITYFHWSFLPWTQYGIVGLCIAYALHRKKLPGLVSSTFYPIIGDRIYGRIGKAINSFSIIAVVCGVSMSLGIACTQFVSGLNIQYGLTNSFFVVCIVVAIVGVLSTISALSGVEKGIKVISDGNMYVVIFFLLFVPIVGSTTYLFNTFFESFGSLVGNLTEMMFFLDVNGEVADRTGYNWIGLWTITYWAWWAAFAPFVGGFLARISKGRTIREFVLACTFVPTILCCLWFAFFGGESIKMILQDGSHIGEEIMANTDNSLFIFLAELPWSTITIPLSMVLILTLIITSVNSATFVAGQFSSGGEYTPSLGIRAFWGAYIVINALMFIYIGGLPTLKSTAIVLAFPFIIITVLMVVSLFKALKSENLA